MTRFEKFLQGIDINDLIKNRLSESHADNWTHDNPKQYYKEMVKVFGEPDSSSKRMARWDNIDGFKYVVLRDEEIPHNFPKEHLDFLYGTKEIKVPDEFHDDLAEITGSIIIDGLKGEVTARCGAMVKNAVTLGFVEDVVSGTAEPTKDEYSRRISNNIVPAWFDDKMQEKKKFLSNLKSKKKDTGGSGWG